jgi:hypothetical protein
MACLLLLVMPFVNCSQHHNHNTALFALGTREFLSCFLFFFGGGFLGFLVSLVPWSLPFSGFLGFAFGVWVRVVLLIMAGITLFAHAADEKVTPPRPSPCAVENKKAPLKAHRRESAVRKKKVG